MRFFQNKRGEIDRDTIINWVIAILVLAIGVSVIYFVISGKGGVALDRIRDLLRFGR